MLTINDYSNLSPAEARTRAVQLQHRIFTEQFNTRFFIRDPRPEYYLKYEMRAFLEGRITEFHGWSDPLGQALDTVRDALESWIEWFWSSTIEPGISAIVSGFRWLWDRAADLASAARDAAVSAASAISSVWSWIQQGASWVYQQITNVVLPYIREHYLLLLGPVGIVLDNVKSLFPQLNTIWNGITETVSGVFETLSKQVAALPQVISSGFQSAVLVLKDVFTTVWNEILVPFGSTLIEGVSAIGEQLGNIAVTVLNTLYNILESFAPLTPDRAGEAAISMLKIAGTASAGLLGMAGVWDLLHPFKDVIPGEIKAMLYDVTGFKIILSGMVGALATAAVIQPSKYMYNYILQPYIPREDDLKRFLWRGRITEQDYREMLRYQGYSKRWVDSFVELTHEIPPPSDLVRFVVREVGLMPEDYPTPDFFLDAMRKWGYEDYWSRAYWWSHWELPAFRQLQEAYFRGIISESELREFIKWHDYSPEPRPGISKSDQEIMFQLIFKMPDKLDARWMRRWGIIDSDEHRDLLKYDGLHPDWLDRVALAEKMNMLSDERTEVKSALRSQYLLGLITTPVLQSKLREVFYTPEETEMLIRAAEERYRYDLTKDAIDAAKYSYRLGYTTKEQLAQQLTDLGISAEKVQRILAIETARAVETKREALQESIYIYGRDTVIKRFREGLTTPAEIEQELRMIGYQDRQIPHFKTIALLERDYDFAMTVLSYTKTAYRKGIIDDTKFINILRSYGFTDEKIMLELSLIKLAYGMGLTEEDIAA